jgi:hypothetical protein
MNSLQRVFRWYLSYLKVAAGAMIVGTIFFFLYAAIKTNRVSSDVIPSPLYVLPGRFFETLGFLFVLLLGLESLLKHARTVLHAAHDLYLEIKSWKAERRQPASNDSSRVRTLPPRDMNTFHQNEP